MQFCNAGTFKERTALSGLGRWAKQVLSKQLSPRVEQGPTALCWRMSLRALGVVSLCSSSSSKAQGKEESWPCFTWHGDGSLHRPYPPKFQYKQLARCLSFSYLPYPPVNICLK